MNHGNHREVASSSRALSGFLPLRRVNSSPGMAERRGNVCHTNMEWTSSIHAPRRKASSMLSREAWTLLFWHLYSALEVQAEHRMFYPIFTSPFRPSTTTHTRGRARIRAKIYHKPIEPLHRPIEAMTVEAKLLWEIHDRSGKIACMTLLEQFQRPYVRTSMPCCHLK